MLYATCYCTHGLNPPHGSNLTTKKAIKYNFHDAQKEETEEKHLGRFVIVLSMTDSWLCGLTNAQLIMAAEVTSSLIASLVSTQESLTN